jgi:F0F1-type ATP synthase epsilon subunit
MIEEKTEAAKEIEAAKAQQTVAAAGKPTMHIKIYSPFRIYYDQDSYSISGVNHTGPFDILPHHHNFITLLDPCELQISGTNGQGQRIRISGGLMHVKADKVTVFLDI